MDNQRLILFSALALVIMLIYQQWQVDYAPELQAPTEQAQVTSVTGAKIETADEEIIPDAPGEAKVIQTEDGKLVIAPSKSKVVEIVTDLFKIKLDTNKGTLVEAKLRNYPVSLEKKDIPIAILKDQKDGALSAQSGLTPVKGLPGAIKKPIFSVEKDRFALEEGADELRVPMKWVGEDGIELTKTFVFTRGSYLINVEQKLQNNSQADWSGSFFGRLRLIPREMEEPGLLSGARSFTGGAISLEDKNYQKVSMDEIKEDWSKDYSGTSGGLIKSKGGWAAMIQHYFIAAWIPSQNDTNYYSTSYSGKTDSHYMNVTESKKSVSPGESYTFNHGLYIGPKVQSVMSEIAPNLERTVDYGPLFFIAQPLFWLLDKIHGVLGNWGWAIIVLTIMLKLLFFKLSEKSYKSMAKMKKLGPKMKQLKERYGDDRQKMNQAMMELYKKEKVNPLGGCLPILVQMPFFLALYWMLLESVELRQAPFMLWIVDLSIKDPYFILPLIMGGTMLVQQKLNPAQMDPMQQRMMMLMPIIFTFLFLWFPAGLVLYWVVNNLLSIAQQWVITKKVEKEGDTPTKPKKGKKAKA